MLFNLSNDLEEALRFSRFDDQHLLSTISHHTFVLDEETWPTAEHCYQAQKYSNHQAYRDRIAKAGSAQEAHKLGNRWWPLKRGDFKHVRRVLMTRACYCKAQQNPEVAAFLLATGDQKLMETSIYDHYWGIGRDHRGLNMLGEVWMDVRRRLRERQAEMANGQE
ncbi:MAG: NADAR family protein [Cellvibrionaceae bacterium]|nr:NADAR family protein [Cellvibrionaceae bacterium]